MLTKQAIIKAVLNWPGRYQTEAGGKFWGMPVSEVPKQLRETGWRNVSHLDEYDLKKLGCVIVTARYVGGVHPKRFCRVVVARVGMKI
jgi:hypothetical protein